MTVKLPTIIDDRDLNPQSLNRVITDIENELNQPRGGTEAEPIEDIRLVPDLGPAGFVLTVNADVDGTEFTRKIDERISEPVPGQVLIGQQDGTYEPTPLTPLSFDFDEVIVSYVTTQTTTRTTTETYTETETYTTTETYQVEETYTTTETFDITEERLQPSRSLGTVNFSGTTVSNEQIVAAHLESSSLNISQYLSNDNSVITGTSGSGTVTSAGGLRPAGDVLNVRSGQRVVEFTIGQLRSNPPYFTNFNGYIPYGNGFVTNFRIYVGRESNSFRLYALVEPEFGHLDVNAGTFSVSMSIQESRTVVVGTGTRPVTRTRLVTRTRPVTRTRTVTRTRPVSTTTITAGDFAKLQTLNWVMPSGSGIIKIAYQHEGVTLAQDLVRLDDLRSLTAQTVDTAVAGLTGTQARRTNLYNLDQELVIARDSSNNILVGITGWTLSSLPNPTFVIENMVIFGDSVSTGGGGGGASTFLALQDTPSQFGTSGQILQVNTQANGLVFVDSPTRDTAAEIIVKLESQSAGSRLSYNFLDDRPNIPAAVDTSRLLPSGGSDGQVLTKTSSSNYAVAWETPTSTSNFDFEDQTIELASSARTFTITNGGAAAQFNRLPFSVLSGASSEIIFSVSGTTSAGVNYSMSGAWTASSLAESRAGNNIGAIRPSRVITGTASGASIRSGDVQFTVSISRNPSFFGIEGDLRFATGSSSQTAGHRVGNATMSVTGLSATNAANLFSLGFTIPQTDNEVYEFEFIRNNAVYAKDLFSAGQLRALTAQTAGTAASTLTLTNSIKIPIFGSTSDFMVISISSNRDLLGAVQGWTNAKYPTYTFKLRKLIVV